MRLSELLARNHRRPDVALKFNVSRPGERYAEISDYKLSKNPSFPVVLNTPIIAACGNGFGWNTRCQAALLVGTRLGLRARAGRRL